MNPIKSQLREFWDREICEDVFGNSGSLGEESEGYEEQSPYAREAFIAEFARFEEGAGKDVFEIGVGMGIDHTEWARVGPNYLAGIDLTPKAVEHTRRRLAVLGLESDLRVADAEDLPFQSESFDIIYAWGVLHHTHHTGWAVNQAYHVLRPGGVVRAMIYHRHSIVGFLLWFRHALLKGRPFKSLKSIFRHHMESPGTKAYTIEETERLFSAFTGVKIHIALSAGDLMAEFNPRRRGIVQRSIAMLWPRKFIQRHLQQRGLYLLVEASKPLAA